MSELTLRINDIRPTPNNLAVETGNFLREKYAIVIATRTTRAPTSRK